MTSSRSMRPSPRLARANRARCAALILACAGAVPLAAQDAAEPDQARSFVSAGLWIGLHADSAFDSAITARLPSGTPLVVLARRGGLAQVRLEDGSEGWMDEAFVTNSAPVVAPPPPPMADATTVIAERDALAEQVAAVTAQRDALAEQLAQAEAEPQDPPTTTPVRVELPDSTLAELEVLTAENARLKQALRGEAPSTPASLFPRHLLDPSTAPGPVRVVAGWGLYTWLAAGASLTLTFFLGALLIQWDVRRRHGGFRV